MLALVFLVYGFGFRGQGSGFRVKGLGASAACCASFFIGATCHTAHDSPLQPFFFYLIQACMQSLSSRRQVPQKMYTRGRENKPPRGRAHKPPRDALQRTR